MAVESASFLLKQAALGIIGLSSGVVISGAVFAFIAVIGVIPRVAYKTGTQKYIILFEEAVIAGGILGACTIAFDYSILLGNFGEAVIGISYGIFVGCLAMCLAEILNVLPILCRRTNLKKGLTLFITSLALGKAAGTLIYFFLPGFTGN